MYCSVQMTVSVAYNCHLLTQLTFTCLHIKPCLMYCVVQITEYEVCHLITQHTLIVLCLHINFANDFVVQSFINIYIDLLLLSINKMYCCNKFPVTFTLLTFLFINV